MEPAETVTETVEKAPKTPKPKRAKKDPRETAPEVKKPKVKAKKKAKAKKPKVKEPTYHEKRVIAGAAMLDELVPGWWKKGKIALTKLDLNSTDRDIWGQIVEGGFRAVRDTLLKKYGTLALCNFGFVVSTPPLHEAWVAYITKRRKEAEHEVEGSGSAAA